MKATWCLAVVLAVLLSGCATVMPAVRVQFWAGDSKTVSVRREQAKQSIACSDPKFDEGFWMSYVDFQKFADAYVFSCKEWDSSAPMINKDQWKALFEKLFHPGGTQ